MNYSRRAEDPRYRLIRLFQSAKGVWRYEFARDGEVRWSSLRTRDEHKARKMYDAMRERHDEPQS